MIRGQKAGPEMEEGEPGRTMPVQPHRSGEIRRRGNHPLHCKQKAAKGGTERAWEDKEQVEGGAGAGSTRPDCWLEGPPSTQA